MSQKKKKQCLVKGCVNNVERRGLCYGCLKKAKEQGTLPPVVKMLSVSCWCTKKTVQVSRRDVMACLTNSCGAPGCEP